MAKTRVLITVKTYPSISKKYHELVCTAGITEEGKWIRIYPIKFRDLDFTDRYSKYQWIEIDLEKNKEDFRPESFRPSTYETVPTVINEIDTSNGWLERKKIVLKEVYTNMDTLIAEAKDKYNVKSLATFKPTEVLDFVWEPVERHWDPERLADMKQLGLFEQVGYKKEPVRKVPYKFSYVFKDETGKERKLMIEDWEVGELFWKYPGDEDLACRKVKEKYFDNFAKTKDLHFFLGTTRVNHYVSRNPFIIIGAFYPPKPKVESQLSLF